MASALCMLQCGFYQQGASDSQSETPNDNDQQSAHGMMVGPVRKAKEVVDWWKVETGRKE